MNAPTSLTALKGEERKQALAAMPPKARVAALIQERRADIAKMLPSHLSADRLLKVATIAATTTPALLECEVPSLITAVGQCAMFGLEPNTVLGHAYMIPFNKNEKDGKGNWNKRKLVQVVIGYKGLIDLARRSGQIVSIAAHEVRAQDHFDYAYGLDEKLIHRPSDAADRGPITHFYAYAKLKDGGTAFEVMSAAQVNEIRDAAAIKNGARRDQNGHLDIKGPWKDHYPEMGRKTVIRRLAKYLPLSIEFQKAVALDEAGDAGAAIGAIDGEFTIEPPEERDESSTGGTLSAGASVDTPPGSEFDKQDSTSASAGASSAQAQQGGGGAAPSNPSGAPTFEDAMAEVKAGNVDAARDIARSLSDGQRAQIETAIANRSAAQGNQSNGAQQAQKPASRRAGSAGQQSSLE